MAEKTVSEVLDMLRKIPAAAHAEPVKSLLRNNLFFFGIDDLRFLGIPHSKLLELGEELGTPNQKLAAELWNSDIYEAKLLSCILSDPNKLTEEQADKWAASFDAWIICNYCCNKAVWKAPFAVKKAYEWSNSDSARAVYAGFSLTAALAANLPQGNADELGFFDSFLFLARKHASSEDADIRRVISSALKQLGQRSADWHEAVVETCREIAAQPSENARWTASQALAELMKSDTLKSLERQGL